MSIFCYFAKLGTSTILAKLLVVLSVKRAKEKVKMETLRAINIL